MAEQMHAFDGAEPRSDPSPRSEAGELAGPERLEDGTIVVGPDADEGTLVVDRGSSSGPPTPPPVAPAAAPRSRRSARRSLRPAPIDLASIRTPVRAPGAGTVTPYAPRPVGAPPTAPPVVVHGPAATRVEDGGLPSVDRRSRRFGALAICGLVLACLVSAGGLATILVMVLGG